ncbi:MAG: CHASE2 domain-containing protein, partial [Blastomonas fulva]
MRILLIWSLVSALLFGLAEFGEPVDDMFRAIRNKARDHDATGQIAVVGIDSRAQQQIGDWPWSAQRYADMIDRLSQAGARRVFFDFPINVAANDPQLPQLVDAMASMNGHVYIAANFAPEAADNSGEQLLPPAALRAVAGLVNTNIRTNGFNVAWHMPYSNKVGNQDIPSIASAISGVTGKPGEAFPIDYAVRLKSLPYVSAGEVLDRRASLDQLRGRDVIIGTNATGIGNRYAVPGQGPSASVFVTALAAETLLDGAPVTYGWWVPFLVAFLTSALLMRVSRTQLVLGMIATLPVCAVGLPLLLESLGRYADIMPALVLMLGAMGH